MELLRGQHPRVLVVGDLMIDHYLFGSVERISPEAPVPVVNVLGEDQTLGGAGNVVRNLLALGAEVRVAAVVGDDPAGHETAVMLASAGVDPGDVLFETGRATPRKSRVMVQRHQMLRLDRESANCIARECEARLLESLPPLVDWAQCVLLSDYAKGVLTPAVTQAAIGRARRRNVPVLVDPKGADSAKYRGATLVTPNKREATQLSGIRIDGEQSLRRAGDALRRSIEAQYILITLSEDGMALFGEETERIAALASEVSDVTGAGDTVLATLGFGIGCGLPVVDAARLANRAAAAVVVKSGCATVTLEEVLHFREPSEATHDPASPRTAESLERIVHDLRRQGKTIVFTNGCFDLLHRGHVDYLQASRACGDCLIVAVNSDDSVRRLKGPGRPIQAAEDRARILASLRCVDHVVVFDEDTPYELIRRIRPHILTKGADYTLNDVVGHDLVDEVRLISLVDGRSTTRTIQRIQKAA